MQVTLWNAFSDSLSWFGDSTALKTFQVNPELFFFTVEVNEASHKTDPYGKESLKVFLIKSLMVTIMELFLSDRYCG